MPVLSIVSHSEEETVALAERLAQSFNAGDLVVLQGKLGSGKTTFVRALAAARGLDETLVNSPSYTFVNEYGGEPPVFHFDLYRLGNISELTEIGWDDYLGRDGIMLVEWGERADGRLPDRYYIVDFSILSQNERRIDFSLVQA
jgi:tRNA threonylcarbamoyladenosine biosynthesis protein TsaE